MNPISRVHTSLGMTVPKVFWKRTLHLPKSSFPARALVKDRPKYIQRCTDDLYTWQRGRQLPQTFTLHDGPPYANGELHIGHALNKILKDLICRSRLPDHVVDWRPGWDCHGLPIELKALQQKGERVLSNAVSVRAAAKRLALATVQKQKECFRKWGIMADWGNAWMTMGEDFEIKQLGVFKEMAKQGLIYRKFKPVHWSPSSQTALAEAELEYRDDHISTAAFVKYPLTVASEALSKKLAIACDTISAVIWTTTPWTLPANRAIGIHRDMEYTVVESLAHGRLLIASSRISDVEHHLNENLKRIRLIDGQDLVGSTYADGVFDKVSARPILHADFVSETSGTGLVHLAPGHGMDDYELCSKHGIEAFAPVDNEGRYIAVACPEQPEVLLGKEVLGAGNRVVLDLLQDRGRLLSHHSYSHNYPYDWRTKKPLIVRATEQWFANVGDIRGDALAALETVKFIPLTSRMRLQAFVKNRSEWCISRQRAWGVPIPALYHVETDEALLTEDSVSHIMSIIRERGIDAWWIDKDLDPAWTPPSYRDSHGQSLYRRGTDTMDVWFDSGTSWTQMESKSEVERHVADCYIEGTDQHRGWFQSSLLTHVASQRSVSAGERPATAPFRTVITHGFTLDQNGHKMSKSVGNVVSPDEIMEATLLPGVAKKVNGKLSELRDAMGPDALRLWVASYDYTTDVRVSQTVLQAINSSLAKYRVTFKLILGILQDFDPSSYAISENLDLSHQVVLLRLQTVSVEVRKYYKSFEFSKAVSEINKFIISDLSAAYFQWIKDAAYCGTSEERRQVQGTMLHIYSQLQQLLYPITPLLIEEAWDYTPMQIQAYQNAPPGQRPLENPDWYLTTFDKLRNDLPHLMAVHARIKGVQEIARLENRMGDSLQSDVCLEINSTEARDLFSRYKTTQLQNIFGISSLKVVSDTAPIPELQQASWSFKGSLRTEGNEICVHVYEPQMAKCIRCWRYAAPREAATAETVCRRCEEVVEELRKTSPALFE